MARTRESARNPRAKKPRKPRAAKPSKREVGQKFIRRLRQSPLHPDDVAWILQHVADKMENGSLTFPLELMLRVQADEANEVPKIAILENPELNDVAVLQKCDWRAA